MPAPLLPSLKAQHAELRSLCRRLKAAAADGSASRPGLERVLDELLPKLFQHETWEAEAFGASWSGMASDHLTLNSLAKDVRLVESHPELYPQGHVARLSRELAKALLAHLRREEAALA